MATARKARTLSPRFKIGYAPSPSRALGRFIDWLDFGTGHIYRDHVIRLYQGLDTEEALIAASIRGGRFFSTTTDYDRKP